MKLLFTYLLLIATFWNIEAQDKIERPALVQQDGRIEVKMAYSRVASLGFQVVVVSLKNNTSDKLRVRLKYSVYGTDGTSQSKRVTSGFGGGKDDYIDIKPSVKIFGEENNCQIDFPTKCKGYEKTVEGGKSCIDHVDYQLISIENISDLERKSEADKLAKVEASKKAKDKQNQENSTKIEKDKADKLAQEKAKLNTDKEASKNLLTKTTVSKSNNPSNNNNAKIEPQKSNKQIAIEEKARLEAERKAEIEIQKKEMALETERQIAAKVESDRQMIQAVQKPLTDFASGILNEPGGRLGVLMMSADDPSRVLYGVTFGSVPAHVNVFVNDDFDFSAWGISLDIFRINVLELIPNFEDSLRNKNVNKIAVSPSIGIFNASQTFNENKDPYHKEPIFKSNFFAAQLGITAIVDIGNGSGFYLKGNYSYNAYYISEKIKPNSETSAYFGLGFGF